MSFLGSQVAMEKSIPKAKLKASQEYGSRTAADAGLIGTPSVSSAMATKAPARPMKRVLPLMVPRTASMVLGCIVCPCADAGIATSSATERTAVDLTIGRGFYSLVGAADEKLSSAPPGRYPAV